MLNIKYILIFMLFILSVDLVDAKTTTFIHGVVIANKQISIPEFPGAHNPSMIKTEHGILLIFRYCPDPEQLWLSHIGALFLDDNFERISEPQLINTRPSGYTKIPSQSEDARIFTCNGKMYLVYNDCIDIECPTIMGRRDMFITELFYENSIFNISRPVKLIHPEKFGSQNWQKNWFPFEWNQEILLGYSISPLEILSTDLTSGICPVLSSSPKTFNWWRLGKLRGGTPAVLVDGQYLAFFHSAIESKSISSAGRKLWHYYMGAYTFSSEPPFEITQITPYPIDGVNFYTYSDYPKRVIFPGGFFVEEDRIYMALGKDDSEVWVCTIDKTLLQKKLMKAQ